MNAQKGMRHNEVENGKLLGDDGLDFEVARFPLLEVERRHLSLHELVDARFPRRRRLRLQRMPKVKRCSRRPQRHLR